MIDFYYKDQPRKHCEKSMYFKLFFIKTLRSVYKKLHSDHETGAADNK